MSGTISEGDPVEYEALQHVARDDIVALQVRPSVPPGGTMPSGRSDFPWYLFSGKVRDTVRWDADINPDRLFADDEHRPADLPLATVHIRPMVLWTITADEVIDTSTDVTQVPPLTGSTGPDDGPRSCLLTYHSDQLIRLVVNEAQTEGGNRYYASRTLGVVFEAASGTIVDAEQVLPPGYDSPE